MNSNAKTLSVAMTISRLRALDFLELMKPELTSLSVLTALCGYYLATVGEFNVWRFALMGIGTALVGGGAGALNEYIEREYDALMRRTEKRPLPSGKVMPFEGLVFGAIVSTMGIVHLAIFTNLLTALIALLTLVLYLVVYTPLKRMTPLATVIGGIPGALPPVMGWTAVRNEITIEAGILFLILFCWQMPHFFSLAWLYRKDYARAGFKLLTVVDDQGVRTSRQILLYCGALVPASLVLAVVGLSGPLYLVGAAVLGTIFFYFAVRFAHSLSASTNRHIHSNLSSRRLFFASLLYLPLLFLLMSLDKV